VGPLTSRPIQKHSLFSQARCAHERTPIRLIRWNAGIGDTAQVQSTSSSKTTSETIGYLPARSGTQFVPGAR
jgi:hypothetical protein